MAIFDRYYGYFSPRELLENEWVVFFALFLLFFALIFLSLSNAFKKKTKKPKYFMDAFLAGPEKGINKGAITIISAVIAFFAASALIRGQILSQYLGDIVTLWVTVIILVIMLVLLIPFYRALKQSTGAGIALGIVLFILWVTLRIIPLQEILPYQYYTYEFEQFYDTITSYAIVIFIIIASIIWGVIKKKK